VWQCSKLTVTANSSVLEKFFLQKHLLFCLHGLIAAVILQGEDKRCKFQSWRCGCRASIKLFRTEDHGWYVSQHNSDHNHPLSAVCGEKRQWPSHRSIDAYTKNFIKYLRENNVSLSKVHSVLGSFYGGVAELPFTKRSLQTICS
jgi:hypothetical protein